MQNYTTVKEKEFREFIRQYHGSLEEDLLMEIRFFYDFSLLSGLRKPCPETNVAKIDYTETPCEYSIRTDLYEAYRKKEQQDKRK